MKHNLIYAWLWLIASLVFLCGCQTGRQQTAVLPGMEYAVPPAADLSGTLAKGTKEAVISEGGFRKSAIVVEDISSGLVLPDKTQGVVVIAGQKRELPQEQVLAARELKLKVRELAEQLLAGVDDFHIAQSVAMPVSFVNMDNLQETSSLGRFIAEQMAYEFSQRGVAVKEYRMDKVIRMRDDGDFILSRKAKTASIAKAVVVAGTYYYDQNAVVVNARLIRPKDGHVLRAANVVFQGTALTRSMLAKTGKKLPVVSIPIRGKIDSNSANVVPQSPFDIGEDIH